ncbi:hypothetical protein DSO57_1017499 [Entomophthora muscae]|uniref:Uncharacterized protein n=1 Tax=Entomophthora muscae TaxID=34485 RepID=A0ACC2TSA3_9FUNG|nr:hypothetical protein DSO57_1017499 [Entomophthora muscae]
MKSFSPRQSAARVNSSPDCKKWNFLAIGRELVGSKSVAPTALIIFGQRIPALIADRFPNEARPEYFRSLAASPTN